MNAVARAVVALVATLFVLGAIGWASRAPYDSPRADVAVLRLAWRMPGGASQVCRDRSQAELDALPVHMRTPQVCETVAVTYRLETEVDDVYVDARRLRPSGARGDRPLAVWLELPLEPGTHEVDVHLVREGSESEDQLEFEADVRANAGEIILITLNEAGELDVR